MEEKNNWEEEETSYNENDTIEENNEEVFDEVTNNKKNIDIKKLIIILVSVAIIGLAIVYFINQKGDDSITLTLITENIQIKVGEKAKIQYEISNKNVDVNFSSSDILIAKVNTNGEVEALSEGKVYVLVSYKYKGNTQGKICSIEVLDETEKKKDGPPSCSLKVFSNGKIIATPVNATKYGYSETYKNGNEIEYQFTSEKIVGVTKFDILPITYYVENSEGEKATCSVIIEMTCTDLLSDCTFKGI